jgi:hypothetical protein
MSAGVFWWWCLMCGIAALNISAWAYSAAVLRRRWSFHSLESYLTCRRQLILSAVYVFGCAFRSALPVFDVPRITLFNTWLSSVIVGRSVATIAELAFVAQWALMLREAARETDSLIVRSVSRLVVPLIIVAEICSWYSVLTTSNIGHVFEETLWGISATLIVTTLIAFHPRWPANWRPILTTAIIIGCAYAAYMFLVDVPMYWSRWVADEAHGRRYLTIAQGLFDTSERRVISHRWQDWRTEVIWMTLYFSVAVWISILLVHAALRKFARRVVRT